MHLPPIDRPETAVDACEERLRRAILDGSIPSGSRLPPERELAPKLGVNRVTLRSALGRLAAAHLLSVRQGSGYVVLEPMRGGGPDLLPPIAELARERGDLPAVASDLLLVRRHLAAAVLERLSRGLGPAELELIARAVDELARRVAEGAGADAIAAADLEVMAAVVDATGSPVLRLCLNPVVSVLSELPDLREALYAEPEVNLAAWRALAAALEAGGAVPAIILEAMAERDRQTVARLTRGRRGEGSKRRS